MKIPRPIRLVGITLAGLSLGALLVVALAHTPWAQQRVLRSVLARIAPDGTIQADRLDYSLLDLSFELHQVRMLSPGDPRPFFAAERLRVQLAPAALRGELAFREIVLEQPRFTVWVDADGTSNFAGEGTRIEQPVRIDRLALRGLAASWQDASADLGFEAEAIDLEVLQGDLLGSRLAAPQPLTLRYGDRSLAIEHQRGKLGWTGLDLLLAELGLGGAGAEVVVDGRVDELLADRSLALETTAAVDLAEMAAALGVEGDAHGTLNADVEATGPVAAPQIALSATSETISWNRVRLTDVAFRGRLEETLVVEEASFGLAGGRVDGTGAIALGPSDESLLAIEFEGLSIGDLASGAGSAATLPVDLASGRLSGSARLDWSGAVPDPQTVEVGAELRLRPGPRARPARAWGGNATVALSGGRTLLDGSLRAGAAGELRLNGLTLEGDELAGDFILDVDDLGRGLELFESYSGTPLSLPVPVSGNARIEGSVAGSAGAPLVTGRARVPRLAFGDAAPLAAESSFSADSAGLRLPDLTISTPAGAVGGSLTLEMETLALEGDVATIGAGLDLAGLLAVAPAELLPSRLPETTGSLAFDLTFAGPLPVPSVAGTVRGEALRMEGYGPADLEVRLSGSPDGTRIETALLEMDRASLRMGGRVAADGASVDLMAHATVADAAALVERPELAALRDLEVDAGLGWNRDSGQLTIDLWRLRAELGPEPLRSLRPARVVYDGTSLAVEDLALSVGDFRLSAAGLLPLAEPLETSTAPAAITVDVVGELGGLESAVELAAAGWTGAELPLRMAGALSATLEVGGSVERPTPRGRLELREGLLAHDAYPALTEISALLEVDRNELRVERFSGALAGVPVAATGALPLALLEVPGAVATAASLARIEAEFGPLGPQAIAAWLPEADLGNAELALAGTIRLTAARLEMATVRGEVVVSRARLGSSGVTLVQAVPTRLEIADGVLTVAALDWVRDPAQRSLDASRVTMSGTVGLTGAMPLDLVVGGQLRLAALAPFLPSGSAIDGRMELELDIDGTVPEPVPLGRVGFAGVAARLDSPRLALTDLAGTLTFDRRSLSAGPGLTGRLNGGDAQLTAEIDLTEPASPTGLLGLTGRSVPFEVAGVRVNSRLDLSASVRGTDDVRVFGSITLLEGGYRTRQSLAAALRSAATSTATSAVPTSGSPLESVALDIRVTAADELVIDTPFAQASADLDLRITGTAARPGVVGDFDLAEGGRVFLNGVTYSVNRGRVAFNDPNRIAPTIDLEAGTRIGQYQVELSISGDAFSPAVEASSDPALGEADVLSLMATGRTLEAAGAEGTQVLREQAFAVLTGQLSGVTRAIGIDSVRLEQGQGLASNPFERPDEADLFPRTTELGTRLTLARDITDWFQLAFSQNLGETGGQSWVGTLELPRGIQLRAGTFDDDTRSLDLRHRLLFGRPPEMGGRRRSARVEAVRIDGSTGVSDEALYGRLTLDPGDDFDFIEWQRDQDRLREALLEADYLEARLRASREAVGTIDDTGRARAYNLIYEIDSGPQTRLEIVGTELDDDARADLRATWVDSIAEEFLLDDLERVARRHLVEHGWLEPRIDVQIAAREPVKTVRIDVEAGARAERTRIEIEGAGELGSAPVRERLRAEGTLLTVWFEPERAIASVRGLYRERGWLDADAAVEAVAASSGRTTRVLRIAPGPRYRITEVTIEGAEAVERDRVHEATALVVGQPFEAPAIDAAVSAALDLYVDRAFNDARVVSATEVDREAAAVTLHLEIQEGARQILQDISIEGRHRTRRGVVDRALRVRRGEPIGARDVEAVRRRLYQVGAFRSVSARLTPAGAPTDQGQPVRLEIALVELPAFELRYGVQVLDIPGREGRETEPGLSTLLTHRNFLGVGASVTLLARGRQDELFGRSAVSFPRLLGLPVRTTLLAQQSRRDEARPFDLPPVSRTETVMQLEQSTTFAGRIVFGYSFNHERSITEDPISPFPPVPTVVTRLSPLAIYDTRNDLFAPSRGLFHSSTLEMSLRSLGSDLPFLKYTARQSAFLRLGPVVLASSLRFGTGRSLQEGVDTLDSSEFYVAGGATTVRGYPEDSLGRTPFFGTFLPGGDAVLVLNQEVRFPVWGWVHGVAFADAGRTFTSIDEMSLSALPASVGGGLRLVTPYVILRLDYGVRLTDVDGIPDASRGRFHFGIGHIF